MSRLYRSRKDRFLAGICGGLGNYFKIDPAFIRLFILAITVLTALFPVFIAYLIGWILIPEAPKGYKPPKYKKLFKSVKNRRISGLCGGLGEYLKVDPTLVRVLFILVMVLTAFIPMVITYCVGSIIIRDKPSKHQPIEVEID